MSRVAERSPDAAAPQRPRWLLPPGGASSGNKKADVSWKEQPFFYATIRLVEKQYAEFAEFALDPKTEGRIHSGLNKELTDFSFLKEEKFPVGANVFERMPSVFRFMKVCTEYENLLLPLKKIISSLLPFCTDDDKREIGESGIVEKLELMLPDLEAKEKTAVYKILELFSKYKISSDMDDLPPKKRVR